MRLIRNNKLFPSSNYINGKSDPYVSKDVITKRQIQNWALELFQSEGFHAVAMTLQQKFLFPGILQFKKHVFSQNTGEYIIASII